MFRLRLLSSSPRIPGWDVASQLPRTTVPQNELVEMTDRFPAPWNPSPVCSLREGEQEAARCLTPFTEFKIPAPKPAGRLIPPPAPNPRPARHTHPTPCSAPSSWDANLLWASLVPSRGECYYYLINSQNKDLVGGGGEIGLEGRFLEGV